LITNKFFDANRGLELFGPTAIGSQIHHGNQWYGNFAEYGGYISGTTPDLTAFKSQFIYDSDDEDPCILYPCPIGPEEVENYEWFKSQTGIGKTCIPTDPFDAPDEDTLASWIR